PSLSRNTSCVVYEMGGSIRKLFSRFDDADVVVGETEVRSLHVDFRHVARSAILVGDGTASLAIGLCRFTFQRVTRQALAVVKGGVFLELLVRVVASDATDLLLV